MIWRDSDSQRFVSRAAKSTTPIATLLLNQAAIAGIGNVYRAEFCFLAGVHPATPAKALSEAKLAELWSLSVVHLAEGVRLNRIVTRDPDEVGKSRGRISRGERLYVYKRAGQPCRRCEEPIARMELANRKVWFCPRCQPPT